MSDALQDLENSIALFSQRLRAAGLHGALAFLNSRTRHRYTGVYQFEPPLLRNFCLFDRENPHVRTMADLVLRDSYCGIMAHSGEPFSTENSLVDERLRAHPARAAMVAYQGIPLRDTTDRCFGSLCHWDARPRVLNAEEASLLFAVAPAIAPDVLRSRRRSRKSAGGTRSTATGRSSEGLEVGIDNEIDDLPRGRGREQTRGG